MQRRRSDRRDLIHSCVCNSKEHPTADMVYQQLHPDNPSLSRGTVYRNLNILVEEGSLIRIPGEVERYDGRVDGHPHLVCRVCGEVSDLAHIGNAWELDRQIEERYGVKIDHHDLIFYGICAQCMKSGAE